ncbi:MAG: cytochrome c3 family protein [Gemmatimonadota bacterium]
MRRALPLVLLPLLVGLPGHGGPADPTAFPHERHAGLFPVGCVLCHGGDAAAPDAGVYPEPARCLACHDGARLPRTTWRGHAPGASLLRFDHDTHAGTLAREAQRATCEQCHGLADPALGGSSQPMAVGPATPERCMTCHAAGGAEHLELPAESCATCHPPLALNPSLPAGRVEALPTPATHSGQGWGAEHAGAADASCAVCHARESCERCHLNGADVPAVRSLQPDPRVAALVAGLAPRYPLPSSHVQADWGWSHGGTAGQGAASCANCHARESCQACHGAGRTTVVAALPVTPDDDARGVRPPVRRSSVHGADFVRGHGAEAAAGTARCSSCHAQATCTECHAGAVAPSFHDDGFTARHGTEAFAADTRCASCHSTELFCRSCHTDAGMAGGRGGAAVFHDREPFWLIGHGQAARQGLESCVTCHTQSSCTSCHSSVGGWGVSPHGADFDARRAEAASPLLCRRCHLGGT